MRQAKVKLGKHDTLYVTLHPSYLHLKLVQPGKAQYSQEIYIPRRKLMPLVRWVVSSIRVVPSDRSRYIPDAVARYLERERQHEQELRRQKREAKRTRQKKARYEAARRRGRRSGGKRH